MRAWLLGAAIVIGAPMAFLLIRYGTLNPCTMLALDMAREQEARSGGTSGDSAVFRFGALLAAATRTPSECVPALWRFHAEANSRRRAECMKERLGGRDNYIRGAAYDTPEWNATLKACSR
jgi:hypothetical protein